MGLSLKAKAVQPIFDVTILQSADLLPLPSLPPCSAAWEASDEELLVCCSRMDRNLSSSAAPAAAALGDARPAERREEQLRGDCTGLSGRDGSLKVPDPKLPSLTRGDDGRFLWAGGAEELRD